MSSSRPSIARAHAVSRRFPALVAAILLFAASASAQEWFVDQRTGNDAADGRSLGTAFRTIGRGAGAAQPGDTVSIRAGTYRETVTPPRSGTAGARIVFQAYQDEVVTISGTERLGGWTRDSGSVYRTALPRDAFSRAIPGNGVDLYDPEVLNYADQVFCDGRMLLLARWPNDPALDPSHPPKRLAQRGVRTRTGTWTTYTIVDSGIAPPATACVGAEIMVQPSDDHWAWLFSGHVVAKDATGLTLKTRNEVGLSDERWRYILSNTRGLLDSPGEWFHDKLAGQLYLWAPDGADPGARIEVKRRIFGFDLTDRSHITIRGLSFFACTITTDRLSGGDNIGYDAAGVVRYPWRGRDFLAPSSHVALERLHLAYPTHFTDVSGHLAEQWGMSSGIVLAGSDHLLRDSTVRWSAGAAVGMSGPRCRVLNNRFEDTNYAAVNVGAVVAKRGMNLELAHSTIRRTGKHGVTYPDYNHPDPSVDTHGVSSGNRFHHNDISDFAIQDGDSGAFYGGGNAGWTRFDHNWLHDAHPNIDGRVGAGNFIATGVYLDNSSHAQVDHNLMWNVEFGINVQQQRPDRAEHLVYNNSISVIWLKARDQNFYPPQGIHTGISWGNDQTGTVMANNLIWCENDATLYVPIESTGGPFNAEVRNNLFWDHVANSTTDPRLASAPFPGRFLLTAASTAAIDQGFDLPASYTRSGVAVPVHRDPDQGALDIGALPLGAQLQDATRRAGSSLPARGSGLRVTAIGADRISLAWTDEAAGETGYAIETSTDGQTWVRSGTTGADAGAGAAVGLSPATSYRLRVRALGAAGAGAASDEVQAVTSGAGGGAVPGAGTSRRSGGGGGCGAGSALALLCCAFALLGRLRWR